MTHYNVHNPGAPKISEFRRLWIACLRTCMRQCGNEREAYARALDLFFEQGDIALRRHAIALRDLDKQAEGLEQMLRQGRPEMEVEE